MIGGVVVIDCITSPPVDAMRAGGVSGLSRYLSWADARDTLHKVIHQDEFDRLHAARFDTLLNWEYAADDWLGGSAAGQAHGTEAARQARALGYPTGCAIPGSADFDMTLSQWNGAGRAYAQAYSGAVRAAGYVAGVYGSWDVLTWCRDTGWFGMYWQAGLATGWSGGRNAQLWPGAHLRQSSTGTISGVDVDINDIIQTDYGQYRGEDVALRDENLISAPSVNALQALDDLWSMEYLGHSGIGGPRDIHFLNRQLNDIQAKVTALAAPVPVTMTDADRQAIADLVVAALPKPPTAAEIADELARRLQG